MAQTPEHGSGKRTVPPSPRAMWRMVLLWVLLVAMTYLFVRLGGQSETGTAALSYTELIGQIDAGNVASIRIDPNAQVADGELTRSSVVDGRAVTRFRTVLPFRDVAPLVARLEERQVPISGKGPGRPWTSILLSLLPWVFLIGFWVFLLRRMQVGGGQQALAFGRSGAKPLSGDTPKVTFADVAGADEAKQELGELIEFLADPQKFQRLGGRIPKGVLLVGPPGTGKTLLARAVAGEAGCPFFSMSGSDFVEMFVGVGAARVRDLFDQGKQNAPCIIFIDELDAVGRQRGAGLGGGHDEREQTLNQLLVELDGFEPNIGVILLAATNRPDVLDPALLRPGRFDRQIVVDLPDVRAREQILSVHARKIPLASDVDLAVIARGTPGMSGADLANVANEAAILAARQNEPSVTMDDFELAKDKVMLGVERRSVVLTEEERRLAAYHESGHVLVNSLITGIDPVYKVTIVPRGRALGLTFSLPETDRRHLTKEYLLGKLAVAYGGRVAEELVFGPDHVTTGAAQDFQAATDMARRMVTAYGMSDALGPVTVDKTKQTVFLGRELAEHRDVSDETARLVDHEVQRITRAAYRRATELIRANLTALHHLARALLERETLDAEEIRVVLRAVRASEQYHDGPEASREHPSVAPA